MPAKKSKLKKAAPKNSLKSLKNAKSVSSDSSSSIDLTPLATPDQININQLFLQALARYKNDAVIQDKKDKLKEINHLGAMVEEFLSCFALIGFSMQGEKVCIMNASNSKDEGALVDLLRSTFLEIANNRP